MDASTTTSILRNGRPLPDDIENAVEVSHEKTNVADQDPNPDPDPPDPHVFGTPGYGSISQRYGSGSGSFYN